MNIPSFIHLTLTTGHKVRIATSHIESYRKRSNSSAAIVGLAISGDWYHTKETPEEIDVLLGISELDISPTNEKGTK